MDTRSEPCARLLAVGSVSHALAACRLLLALGVSSLGGGAVRENSPNLMCFLIKVEEELVHYCICCTS